MAIEVIGREEELTSIEAFLGRLEEGPGGLVLSGEPGIGKTILWEAGVDQAEHHDRCVLVHRSVEAEASLSFTGLSDLLAPVFDDVAPSLAPLRRRALEVALLLAEPGDHAPDPRAIGLALLDALQLLAEQKPVVVALDDLQVARPFIGRRAADRAPASEDRARRPADDGPGGAGPGKPCGARSLVPGRATRADHARSADPRCAPPSVARAGQARADASRARPRAGGIGGKPVLRPRARPRARPDGRPT